MSGTTVKLSPHLDITEVATIYENFVQAFENSGTIRIDGSLVERADTAGIQLLLAVKRACERQQRQVSWEAPSRPLVRSAKKLGLDQALELHES